MNPTQAIAQFLEWLQTLISGKKPPKPEPPPTFSKATTIVQWQLGKFHCIGVLPNNQRSGYFYTLAVEQVRQVRSKTPAEARWINENAASMVPTHRFHLFYCPPAVRDGRVILGRPVTVFLIERNCNIKNRPGTSADWVACGEIAPKIRDRIIEICNSPPTETRYQIKGKILREGERSQTSAQSMKRFEAANPNRLELIPYSAQTTKIWESFIDELLRCPQKS